jgi:hypothetical protein
LSTSTSTAILKDLELGVGLKAEGHILMQLDLTSDAPSFTDDEAGEKKLFETLVRVISESFRNAFPLGDQNVLPLMRIQDGNLVVRGLQTGQRVVVSCENLAEVICPSDHNDPEAFGSFNIQNVNDGDMPPDEDFLFFGTNNFRGLITTDATEYDKLRTTTFTSFHNSNELRQFEWQEGKKWNDEVSVPFRPHHLRSLIHQINATGRVYYDEEEEDDIEEDDYITENEFIFQIGIINGPDVIKMPQEWVTLTPGPYVPFNYFQNEGGQKCSSDWSANFCQTFIDRMQKSLPRMNFLQPYCASENVMLKAEPSEPRYPLSRSRRPLVLCWKPTTSPKCNGVQLCAMMRFQLFFRPHCYGHKLFFNPLSYWETNQSGWVTAASLDSVRPDARVPDDTLSNGKMSNRNAAKILNQEFLLLNDFSPFPYSITTPAFTDPINLVYIGQTVERGNLIDCTKPGMERYFDDNSRNTSILARLKYDNSSGEWRPTPDDQQSLHLAVFHRDLEFQPVDSDGRVVPFANNNTLTVLIR